ncbi:PIG-L deacetylase family protein [Pelatocladus sp. BLCC-F211]|uniref:PIG-L deacetylase family protein n=1 Tax=Pelatocladus sp. BLCC-F211 TaxID=3342752 RepID=UPI0035B7F2A2
MSLTTIPSQILGKLSNTLQFIEVEILFDWILPKKSQTLTVTQKSTLVFAPHQDDETLGCGGLIALKRELGVPVKVAFLTDGHKSYLDIKPEDIVQVRKQEAQEALNILGVAPSDVYFIDQPDGELRQLSNEQKLHTINQLVQLLQSFQPEEIYVPHQKDQHPDHEATYDLVKDALNKSGIKAQLFQYQVWLFWGRPVLFQIDLKKLGQSYILPIKSVVEKKRQAIQVYRSQHHIFPRTFIKRFFKSKEIFFQS